MFAKIQSTAKNAPTGWMVGAFTQLTFTTIFGAFAITNAATEVRMISGTMYIPLSTALYTQPSAAGLRLATIC